MNNSFKSSHDSFCHCRRCLSSAWGRWLDDLGSRTSRGNWDWFVTISHRTETYHWLRGFPIKGSKPSPEYGHHFFQFFVAHLERELSSRVEFVVADQFGSINGRYHQHGLMAADGLEEYPRSEIECWLRRRAGFSRVLPFQHGAAFYIGKFLGVAVLEADWSIHVGPEDTSRNQETQAGKNVIIQSAALPHSVFHQSLHTHRNYGRKRR